MKNTTLEQVKDAIRHPCAWPGGYPVYTIMTDGALLCPQCARENYRQIVHATKTRARSDWQAAGADVYWEGEPEPCGHCGKLLESAYGPVESDTDGDE